MLTKQFCLRGVQKMVLINAQNAVFIKSKNIMAYIFSIKIFFFVDKPQCFCVWQTDFLVFCSTQIFPASINHL